MESFVSSAASLGIFDRTIFPLLQNFLMSSKKIFHDEAKSSGKLADVVDEWLPVEAVAIDNYIDDLIESKKYFLISNLIAILYWILKREQGAHHVSVSKAWLIHS